MATEHHVMPFMIIVCLPLRAARCRLITPPFRFSRRADAVRLLPPRRDIYLMRLCCL